MKTTRTKIPALLIHMLKYNPTIKCLETAMVAHALCIAYGSIQNYRTERTHSYITSDYLPDAGAVADFNAYINNKFPDGKSAIIQLLQSEAAKYPITTEPLRKPKQRRTRKK